MKDKQAMTEPTTEELQTVCREVISTIEDAQHDSDVRWRVERWHGETETMARARR